MQFTTTSVRVAVQSRLGGYPVCRLFFQACLDFHNLIKQPPQPSRSDRGWTFSFLFLVCAFLSVGVCVTRIAYYAYVSPFVDDVSFLHQY